MARDPAHLPSSSSHFLRTAPYGTMAEHENKKDFQGNDSLDAPSRSRSLTDELQLEGLTLYEKKCILINREIDCHGMGKYQWWIWGLCGFGYMLDLLWAQAFGLVLSPLQQELGFPGECRSCRSLSHALNRHQRAKPVIYRSRFPLDSRLVSTESWYRTKV